MKRKRPKKRAPYNLARACRCFYDHLVKETKMRQHDGMYTNIMDMFRACTSKQDRNQFYAGLPTEAATGIACCDAWWRYGREIWALTANVQEVFQKTSVKSMYRGDFHMPSPCMYIALPENTTLYLQSEKTGAHRVAGLFLYDVSLDKEFSLPVRSEDTGLATANGLFLYAWGEANENSRHAADDSVQYWALQWPSESEEALNLETITMTATQRGITQKSALPSNWSTTRALIRLAVNTVLYLRLCIEDQGPPTDLEEARSAKMRQASQNLGNHRQQRIERQLQDLGSASKIHMVAPDLEEKQKKRKKSQDRPRPTANRGPYSVGWHVRWTRYGPMKTENGENIPAHQRAARLTIIDGYEVSSTTEKS